MTVVIVGALMLIGVFSAQAATVTTAPASDGELVAVEILGLRLGNYLYNVNWVLGSAALAYGNLPNFESDPEGLFNTGVALTALVNDALNTEAPGVKRVGVNKYGGAGWTQDYLKGFAMDRGTANYFAFATVGE
jgi:hypothetical protein